MIRADNYITIQGWMCLDKENGGLGLKGNDLIVYAIIYGFCQVKGHCYNGSLNYLEQWTNSTRQGIIKNLKNLVDEQLIIKYNSEPTNSYFINYDALPFNNVNKVNNEQVNLVTEHVNSVTNDVNSVTEVCEQSTHNNINNNITNNINNIGTDYKSQVYLDNITKNIIQYFNEICKTNFRYNTTFTKKLIKDRLNEGFSLNDFKNVIKYKYDQWGKSPFKFGGNGQYSDTYLRPKTLFGQNFESYLNEAIVADAHYSSSESSECVNGSYSVSEPASCDRSNLVF